MRYRGLPVEDLKQPELRQVTEAFITQFRADSIRTAADGRLNSDWHNCLVLCGTNRSGKTRLACAIAKGLAHADFDVRYATAAEAIFALHGSPEFVQELCSTDFLVLDCGDLESDVMAALGGPHIADIVQRRFKRNRALLLITNCDLNDLQRFLGNQAFEELQERAWKALELNAPKQKRRARSRRRNQNA